MRELAEALATWGLRLDPDRLTRFERYYHELIAWNRRVNLTRITDRDGVAKFHFMDSLAPWLFAEQLGVARATRLVDVGSGAGFPGVPIKVLFPHLETALIESSLKKANFLRHLVAALGLERCAVMAVRVEVLGHEPNYREQYGMAVARAVAPLAVLAELLLPLVALGGLAIAWKTLPLGDELKAAEAAIVACGGGDVTIHQYRLPGAEKERALVVIEKTKPTPDHLPRRAGLPFKRPLRCLL